MHNANFSTVRAFLFDLDGTLIDSRLDLVNSVNFMLQAMQRDVLPLAIVASYIGHGAPKLVASALGPDTPDADRKRGLEIFLAHYNEHCPPFVWTATADAILDKVSRFCERTSGTRH